MTHSNQYLNLSSHHPLNHKLGVIHICYTLSQRKRMQKKEITHMKYAFGA